MQSLSTRPFSYSGLEVRMLLEFVSNDYGVGIGRDPIDVERRAVGQPININTSIEDRISAPVLSSVIP